MSEGIKLILYMKFCVSLTVKCGRMQDYYSPSNRMRDRERERERERERDVYKSNHRAHETHRESANE